MEEENVQQPIPLQGRRLLWLIPLPEKKPKAAKPVKALVATDDANTFYGRAMEWTHRADKVISLALGYLLAIASVLGFMDVLSNGQVLSHAPWAFYLWLLIMGLGVDFQLLLVIGRFPDLVQTVESKVLRVVFILFNLAFLTFLAYMSATIAAVFTQHVDAGKGTVIDAMATLGIDAHTFVFQRAWLATLLLILMAVDRTLERWRMRQLVTQNSPENATQATPPPLQGVQQSELADALKQIAEMQAQMLASMQRQPQVTIEQATIEQVTRVTVEAVKESLLQAGSAPLQIPVDAASKADVPPFERDYGPEIEALYIENPTITPEEVKEKMKCSLPTAKKWLDRAESKVDKLQITMEWLSKQPQITDEELAEHLGLKRPVSARFWRRVAMEKVRETAL